MHTAEAACDVTSSASEGGKRGELGGGERVRETAKRVAPRRRRRRREQKGSNCPKLGLCFFNTRFRMRNVLLRPVKLWRTRFRTGNQNKFFTQHIINLRNSQPQDGMAIGLDGSKMGIWKSISNS